jgi:DNA-binding MarR family transcriptional regulator
MSRPGAPGGSAVFLISALGFVASRSFHDALASIDLEPRHFGVLNLVALSEGTSQQALAEPLRIPAPRMVAIVDELEHRKLLERRRNPDDRRAYALYLTPQGKKVLDRARRIARENDERFCAPLQPSERDQLLALLGRLAGQNLQGGVHPGLVAPE